MRVIPGSKSSMKILHFQNSCTPGDENELFSYTVSMYNTSTQQCFNYTWSLSNKYKEPKLYSQKSENDKIMTRAHLE